MKLIISNQKVIISLYALLALIASILSLTSGSKSYVEGGIEYNKYNNYTLFEKSFDHLSNNQDLYIPYPDEQWDLYKYTPTFAVFFGLFSVFPDWVGLTMWNLLNALILLMAVYTLPKLTVYQKGLVLLIVIFELMTSMQNAQSNALLAGLLLLSFGLLEKNKPILASFCVVFSVFIKPFGIVGFALFLLYQKKWQTALSALGWAIMLFAAPLLFVSFEQYMALFDSYFKLLANDHTTNALSVELGATYGLSVMGWLHSWFSVDIAKNYIVAIGIVIFLLPFFRINMYKASMFKYLLVCSILIWVVIFNHKAESPTFIIAMSGVALWFIASKKSKLNVILFASAFIFASLSPSDIFPKFMREAYITPYKLKVFPCILIWLKIIYDMMVLKNTDLKTVNGNLEQP